MSWKGEWLAQILKAVHLVRWPIGSCSFFPLLARRGGSLPHFHQTDWHCWVYKYIYLFIAVMPKCRAHLMKSVRVDPKVGSQLEVVNHQRVAIRVRQGHKLRGLIVSALPASSGLLPILLWVASIDHGFYLFFFSFCKPAQQLEGWANG